MSHNRRHRLDTGSGNIVERVLLGQAPAGGLAVRAQHQRLGGLDHRQVRLVAALRLAGIGDLDAGILDIEDNRARRAPLGRRAVGQTPKGGFP